MWSGLYLSTVFFRWSYKNQEKFHPCCMNKLLIHGKVNSSWMKMLQVFVFCHEVCMKTDYVMNLWKTWTVNNIHNPDYIFVSRLFTHFIWWILLIMAKNHENCVCKLVKCQNIVFLCIFMLKAWICTCYMVNVIWYRNR